MVRDVARCLKLYLVPYIVYTNSEGFGDKYPFLMGGSLIDINVTWTDVHVFKRKM